MALPEKPKPLDKSQKVIHIIFIDFYTPAWTAGKKGETDMAQNTYLKWMAENTDTRWCNDSALRDDYMAAMQSGAVGCTTTPPLSFEALTTNTDRFGARVEEVREKFSGRGKVVEYFRILVPDIAKEFYPLYEKTGGKTGYVRSQVEPRLSGDAEAMLAMGKTISTFAKNVMVKIPGTKAGIFVLEELAALGIPTTPTVCVSVSQLIATAQAYERGCARAKKAGIPVPATTTAFVMGRLQDYLASLNAERGNPVSTQDLETAVLAAIKRTYQIFKKEGYAQTIMPAAFRCARQVSELAGGVFEMTIHPKVQRVVSEAFDKGEIKKEKRIDAEVDEAAVDRVLKAFPEFGKAYDPKGMSESEFDSFGGVIMTLDGFDKTGWQKLLSL
jgi:transaldolase